MVKRRYLAHFGAIGFLLYAGLTHGQVSTWQYQYDANGNLTQITDPLGNVTNQSWDGLNRLLQTQQPAPTVVSSRPQIVYTYDGRGQLTSVTDPRNVVTSYTVNGFGDVTVQASPDAGTTTTTYDEAGNLKISTDAKGQSATRQYDGLNRIVKIIYSDGSVISFNYDQGANSVGRLSSIEDSSGKTEYSYDQRGHLLEEKHTINGASYATSYSYDTAGRLASMTYPSSRQFIYLRDALGRVMQINTIKDGTTNIVASQITYRPFGDVASFVNGANQLVSRTRDLDGRIDSYTMGSRSYTITNDAAGRPTAIAELANSANTQSYVYDNLSRLTQYNGTGATQSLSYDATGNRIGKIVASSITNFAIPSTSNRLAQTSGAQNIAYSTDANGSIVNNGNAQFSYDVRGRMTSADTALGGVQYKVNALGQRVTKVMQGTTTIFHYDQDGKVISENTESSGFWTDYVYLGNIPIALFK